MNPAPTRQRSGTVPAQRSRGRKPSSTDWLQILDIDGPFLAAPVITDTWPDGLQALDPDRMKALRTQSAMYDANVGARDSYIRHVLTDTLDWRSNLVWGPGAAQYTVAVPEHQTTVDITFAMIDADVAESGAIAAIPEQREGSDGQGSSAKPLLLGMVVASGARTTGRAPAGSGTWPAGPADRLAHAMRTRGVPLGLVTNGNTWTLVAITEGAVSTATWTRHGWLEEAETLRAFVAILDRARFLGVEDKKTLPGLLKASLARQEEITERLSEQSQSVVEMLVATLGRADAHHRAETGKALLPAHVEPAEVYQATVTVLMRMVFLLYAEERGLLPLDDDTYATTYAVSTLANELRDRATDQGEDALERTHVGWHRFLAVSRAVHRGARHDQLLITAYGGGLFDPDRHPWLEGRTTADETLGAQHVPAIDDRTLLRALDSLQTVQFTHERRRVSYRSLDVEQIGYVYEGLLDQDARRADGWVVSIAVSDRDLRKDGPELALTDLETHHHQGDDALAVWLHEHTKKVGTARSKASILKALQPPTGDELSRHTRLVREACGNDDAATKRLMPYCRLLRLDPRDLPVIYPPHSLYLTDSEARAQTGAVYTPRALAEQVVEGALEPLVYDPGPLDTEDKGAWRIKSAEQILALKIVDIAAGSGAFLVSAARYLAQRLIEARLVAALDRVLAEPADVNPLLAEDQPRLAAERAEQDELAARRAVIDHCIYGVDINPMAVEMAKLSLWLITLDRNRPFGFLDDRLAVGDSLLGVTHVDQISALHFDAKAGRRLQDGVPPLFVADMDQVLAEAAELRRQIAEIDLRDTRDADHKARLLAQAGEVTAWLSLVADGISAASLNGGTDAQCLALSSKCADKGHGADPDGQVLAEYVSFGLTRPDGTQHRPAHFPLLFPEVFRGGHDGFDAVISNPPFLGGQKVTGAFGSPYREHLVCALGAGMRGSADLVAYMLLRSVALLSPSNGQVGLIATNTLAQGETRTIGLDRLMREGLDVRAAVRSQRWPTLRAALDYCITWGSRRHRALDVRASADGALVTSISSSLESAEEVHRDPQRLAGERALSFQGTIVLGQGFTLNASEAQILLTKEFRNAEVVVPYMNGKDFNSAPNQAAHRWIINFRDWPADRAQTYADCWARVEELVKPERQRVRPDGSLVQRRTRSERYWQYAEKAPGLYRALESKDRALVRGITSTNHTWGFISAKQVIDQTLWVFASEDHALFALLQSNVHALWWLKYGPTLGASVRYTLADVYDTFPQAPATVELRFAGVELEDARRGIMVHRSIGLTKLYNLINSPSVTESDIAELRDLHARLDVLVLKAYGWDDLADAVEWGHFDSRQGSQWTPRPTIATEILDRLLNMNHTQHAEEVAAGLRGTAGNRGSRIKTLSGAAKATSGAES